MIYRLTTSSLLAAALVAAVCCSNNFGLLSFAQTKKSTAARPRPAPRPARAQGARDLAQPQATQAVAADPEPAAAPAPEEPPAAERPVPRPAPVAAPQANRRKLVMVPDFDARGLPNWWGTWDIGSLFGNVMVSHLSRTESYTIVERERMNEILGELATSGGTEYKQERFTKAGKLLGADLILFGYLTNFTRKKSNKVFYEEYSAGIAFNVRLVDIASGRVVRSAEIEYTSPKDRKMSMSGKDQINPNDSDFLQSLFGKAINESVRQVVVKLEGGSDAHASQVAGSTGGGSVGAPAANFQPAASAGPVKGMIAAVDGETIIINRGQTHGVKVGSHFVVTKVVREIRDPETNQVIRQVTEEVARIKVTNVEATSSDGVLVSAKGKLSVKDQVVLVD